MVILFLYSFCLFALYSSVYFICFSLFVVVLFFFFFFSSRRRHTRSTRDWSSDVCSSDLTVAGSAADTQYYAADPATVAAQMIDMVPMRRYGSAEEVATVVAFLLSTDEIGRASCRERV